jgi:hypothetical protein
MHFTAHVMTWHVRLYSETAVSETIRNRTHVHILFCLE